MTWMRLKDLVQNHRFEIEKTGGGKRDWVFRSAADDPIADVDFVTLGAGTNKMAVRVAGEPWVLLFGKSGRSVERVGFREEVDTLKALGQRGLTVPKPFDGGAQAQYIFDITVWNDGDEPAVPAFFQEFMSRDEFVEMTKTTPRERDEFAKHQIVTGGRVPATIEKTLTDLEKIQTEMNSGPWGDFQVMYSKRTGALIVFDPLPNDPNAAAYRKSITTWLEDIAEAIRTSKTVSARLQKSVEEQQAKNVSGGRHVRRHSLG